jgi:hypothetical protein
MNAGGRGPGLRGLTRKCIASLAAESPPGYSETRAVCMASL